MAAQVHTEFFSAAHFQRAYELLPPPDFMADYAAFCWRSRFAGDTGPQSPVQEKLFANLASSIVFSYGSHFTICRNGQRLLINEAVMVGPHSCPVEFEHTADNALEGIKLKAGGVYRLLGVPAGLLHNQVLPLRAVLGARGPQNLQQLCARAASGPTAGNLHRLAAVEEALHIFSAQLHDALPVEQVARRVHLTTRTLNRYFHDTVGLPPKKAFAILRLRTALNDCTRPGGRFSVHDYGYADHSHFYKDLRTYTSLRSVRRTDFV